MIIYLLLYKYVYYYINMFLFNIRIVTNGYENSLNDFSVPITLRFLF